MRYMKVEYLDPLAGPSKPRTAFINSSAASICRFCLCRWLGFLLFRPGASVLGSLWDLVTTYNWACNPTYNPPKWAYRGYPNYK